MDHNDFMDNLEAAIDKGFCWVDGEQHFCTETAVNEVIDLLEKEGLIMFYNEN